MNRRAVVVIALGAAGSLFSVFWMIFGVIVLGMGVATRSMGVLIVVAGGVLPFAGSMAVLWAGVRHRIASSRLNDLAVVAHRYPVVTAVQLAEALGTTVEQADDLLLMALRKGLVTVFGGSDRS